ncbi:MAG TPA: hypothetical protein VE172_10085 [Stackebrandtia sp.]|jgi:hypothetical protein|uniref:nucleotidyltransferase domain-containing protein n=1 Tax=Stackebrandtia sp. TaxID=2023065 RepID=UPI002D55DF71|nr:hypothetical protein [Stackebrandtia sp.]HZE39146.1 hypothetical protein [Stackebrandtia sp.]
MPEAPRLVANDLSEPEFLSWYGPWDPLSPTEIAELLDGSGVRWWIVGGLAIDAATGTSRPHDDVDVTLPMRDVAALRAHLPAMHFWEAHSGSLNPLLGDNPMMPGRQQLWARRDATEPWIMDLPLSIVEGDEWVFKRDHSIRLPMSRAVVTAADGLSYMAPQAVLLHKSKQMRDKDRVDFDRTVGGLDAEARGWLAAAIARQHPDHEWLDRL